ncbi:LuxR C-terminal-related transcriptional regulator [Ignatzschineria sp. LJL83]
MQNISKVQQTSYSVLVVDQNRLFREKIQYLLSQYAKNALTITAVSELDYQSQQDLQDQRIDLLFLEKSVLHNDHLFTILKRISRSYPALKIIFFSHQEDLELEKKSAYFKVPTIQKVISSESLFQIMDDTLHPISQDVDTTHITPREREILTWLIKGDSNKQIARELNISESTVKIHIQNILRKMDVSSRVEAAVFAVTNKLIQ